MHTELTSVVPSLKKKQIKQKTSGGGGFCYSRARIGTDRGPCVGTLQGRAGVQQAEGNREGKPACPAELTEKELRQVFLLDCFAD